VMFALDAHPDGVAQWTGWVSLGLAAWPLTIWTRQRFRGRPRQRWLVENVVLWVCASGALLGLEWTYHQYQRIILSPVMALLLGIVAWRRWRGGPRPS